MKTTERKLTTEWANRIEQKPIDWLWRPWLARGVITVVDGEQGVGKSSLLFDVIARVTTGRAFPQFDETADERPRPEGDAGRADRAGDAATVRAPGQVLLLALDDPVDSVVAPRLAAAGAELANVVIVRNTEEGGSDGPAPVAEQPGCRSRSALQLPRDLELLAAKCRELRPQLIVIDSLSTALGQDDNGRPIKANDEPGMCRLTVPLKDLAEDEQTAIVLIRRSNRTAGAAALRRAASPAIPAQARAVLLLAADPLAPESRVLAMTRCNLDAAPCSLRFEAAGAPIRWLGPSDLTPDDLLRTGEEKKLPAAVVSAMYFLKTTLFGPRTYTWAELTELAAKENIAEITLRRARQVLELIKTPSGQRGYVWSLPPKILDEMHRAERLIGR